MPTTPKTTWAAGDEYNLEPDYNRQTENYRRLYEAAKPVAGIWPLAPMREYTTAQLPYADELNAVEENYAGLARRVWPTGAFLPRRVLEDEGPQWNHDDFNRIEGLVVTLSGIIPRSLGTAHTLDFVMGGDDFGT